MTRNPRYTSLSCFGPLRASSVWVTQLIKWPALHLALILTMLSISLTAQDFDSDSIYYTPITKTPPATVERQVSVFRDTTKTGSNVDYYFDMSIGTLVGCHDCSNGTELTFSTWMTHGVTLGKKTRVGLGTGFDSYLGWKSVPVFASASYDLVGTKNTHAVFVQAQYGWGFTWFHTSDIGTPLTDQDGGVAFAALIGYRVKYHNLRVAISTGYKRQSASLVYETPSWYTNERGEWVQGTANRRTVDIDLGRAAVNVVFSWK
jgi:hypothetical protein